MKVLILGVSGMIGSTTLRVFNQKEGLEVYGTIRNDYARSFFDPSIVGRIISGVDVEKSDSMIRVLSEIRPDVVINCVGLTKHKPSAEDPLVSVPINSLMPHRLAGLCELIGARLIHVSTDCVFSGLKGGYTESDCPDATDVYGRSKALGEVNYPHAITLRTSTIGHELQSQYGLLDWFLLQREACNGYARAIFSGLPTVIFAEIMRDIVLPRSELSGLYHVGAQPINKFDLLKLIAEVYDKKIEILRDEKFVIDRSLSSVRFQQDTGFIAPEWPELIKKMHFYK